MNRTIPSFLCAAALLLAAAGTSCASRGGQPQPDSYGAGGGEDGTHLEVRRPARAAASDPYSAENVRGDRTFSEKLFGLGRYEKVEPFAVTLKPALGKSFARDGWLIWKPGTDLAGLLVRYDTAYYALYLAADEREALVRAVGSYLADFDARALDEKAKKTERAYGRAGGYEEFGVAEAMMSHYARPDVYFGYRFVDGSPYFCVYAAKAPNLAEGSVAKNVEGTVDQKYYLTRAQARRLAEFLADENIQGLLAPAQEAEDAAGPDEY